MISARHADLGTYYREAVLDALSIAHLTIEIHHCDLRHEEPRAVQVAHQHEH